MRTLEIVLRWDGKVVNKVLGLQELSETYAQQLAGRLYAIGKSYTESGKPILP